MIQEITNRRSIRKYKPVDVSREIIEEIIKAGILAPSSKNRQPWKLIVAAGNAKEEVLAVMEQGLKREKTCPLLPESAVHIEGPGIHCVL